MRMKGSSRINVAPRRRPNATYYDVRLWLLVGPASVCTAVGATAIATGVGMVELFDVLAELDARLPWAFRAHMLAGGLGLAILPLAFASRRWLVRWHKSLGRVALMALFTGSLLGAFSGLASLATPAARAGFFAQGLAGCALLYGAYRAVRQGQFAMHARLMQAAAAVMSGVIVLRLGTWGAAKLDLDFPMAYAALAWGAWLLPLAIVCAWQARSVADPPLRWR